MTVGFLKEFLSIINDSDEVILFSGESGIAPVRSIKAVQHCYACGGDGKYFTHGASKISDFIACPHCKGTGKHPYVTLSDYD